MYSLFCSAISSDVLSFPFCRLFWSNAINETKREHTGRCCALLFLMEKLICFPLLCSDALLYSTILILYPSSLSVLLSNFFLLLHALLRCCYFHLSCLLVLSTGFFYFRPTSCLLVSSTFICLVYLYIPSFVQLLVYLILCFFSWKIINHISQACS